MSSNRFSCFGPRSAWCSYLSVPTWQTCCSAECLAVPTRYLSNCRLVRAGFGLTRQLLTENLILSLAGAATGALLAAKGMPLLLELLPADLPRQETVSVDTVTLLFILCIAVLASVAFGTLPALLGTNTNLSHILKSSSRTLAGGRAANWIQDAIVISQFALATVIVFVAGLLTHTFMNLRAVDPGFAPDGLLTAEVQLPSSRFREAGQQLAFFRQALDRIRAIPGVSDAKPVVWGDGNGPADVRRCFAHPGSGGVSRVLHSCPARCQSRSDGGTEA